MYSHNPATTLLRKYFTRRSRDAACRTRSERVPRHRGACAALRDVPGFGRGSRLFAATAAELGMPVDLRPSWGIAHH